MQIKMPLLTKQQREQLIKQCATVIDNIPESAYATMARVTLAALTSEPSEYRDIWDARVGKNEAQEMEKEGYTLRKLYDVPQVTTPDPIDLTECKKVWYEHDDISHEIVCIPVSEIKKALKAAGYGVRL